MKRLLTIFALLLSAHLMAQETLEQTKTSANRESNTYASIGVGPLPILLPVFGIGHRESWNHHGFDTSLQVATIVSITALRYNLLYSYIVHPNPEGQTYLNLGAAVGTIFHHGLSSIFTSPEFIVGREWTNSSKEKRFCQVEISFPNFSWHYKHHPNEFKNHNLHYFPIATLSYGFMF
jgi:hypothetical protein